MIQKAGTSVLLAGALVLGSAFAQQPGATNGAVVATAKAPGKGGVAGLVTTTATIESIEAATRTVTLKTPDGRTTRIVAGPEVRNFDQLAVGDRIVTRHLEAVSFELKPGGTGIRERSEQQASDRAALGATPGGVVSKRVTVVADVLAINARTQTLTLRGPEHTMELRVPDPKQLKLVKVGDQVVATFTEAVAVSVEHATPAAPAKK